MSDYESIHGTRVKYLSSDPTLNSSTEGQVWYNSNSGTNKSLVQIKSTSSGGNLNTARFGGGAGVSGAQASGLFFGGATNTPGTTKTNATEEYSGFTWSAENNLNTSRIYLAGFGTQTAAVAAGGFVTTNKTEVEEYDGSSWTEVTDIPTAGRSQGAAGTLRAGLFFGAADSPQVKTFEYDGTNWTAGGDLNTGRKYMAGTGTQTAALAVGGSLGTPVQSNATEEYDGSSWTSVNNINTARRALAGFGTQTSAAIGGGTNGSSTQTGIEEYDGTDWTTSPATLSTARRYLGGFGSNLNAGVFCAGKNGTVYNNTEEYNSTINTFTAASWASGGNIGTTRRNMAAGGITSAGIIAGGFVPPSKAEVEEYNGTSWSEQNNLPVSKEAGGGGFGVQTAFVVAGGSGPDNITNGYSQSTQEYDGTNWTATGNLNVARLGAGGFSGTETAGLGFGGYVGASSPYAPPPKTQSTEEYNGSAWTTGNTVPTGPNTYFFASGTQTATVGVRSTTDGGTVLYDGTNWTAGSGTLTAIRSIGSMAKNGTSTASVVFGGNAGNPPVRTAATEEYNGTSFVNTASMATARGSMGGSGNTAEAFAAGGYTGTANVNSTEEYTYQGTPAATASTLTSS